MAEPARLIVLRGGRTTFDYKNGDGELKLADASGGESISGVKPDQSPPPAIRAGIETADYARSNRSRFITLVHAAVKSRTNFSFESLHA